MYVEINNNRIAESDCKHGHNVMFFYNLWIKIDPMNDEFIQKM